MKQLLVCTPKRLPQDLLVSAARTAVDINPMNHPPMHRLTRLLPDFKSTPLRIAVVTTKYWGIRGVRLTVGFMDNPPADLRKRILLHMNAWGATANTKFVETRTGAQIRIAREGGAGRRVLVLFGNGRPPHSQESTDHEPGGVQYEHAGIGIPPGGST